MDVQQLIARVKVTPDCTVRQPAGIPALQGGHVLPEDVRRFYELCGGMTLYESEFYTVRIVGPDEFIPADPVLLAGIMEDLMANRIFDDRTISKDWYIIADLRDASYIVIDCSAQRLGRCYSAFWEVYPHKGDMPIIARSFTELLARLIEDKGERWYFLRDDFVSYGDAYDDVV